MPASHANEDMLEQGVVTMEGGGYDQGEARDRLVLQLIKVQGVVVLDLARVFGESLKQSKRAFKELYGKSSGFESVWILTLKSYYPLYPTPD